MWNFQPSIDTMAASCYRIILAAGLYFMLKSKAFFGIKRADFFRKSIGSFHCLDQFVLLNNRQVDMKSRYIYDYVWVFNCIFFKKNPPLHYIQVVFESMACFLAKGLSMNHFTYGFILDWIANHGQNLLMNYSSAIFRDIKGRMVLAGRCIAAE